MQRYLQLCAKIEETVGEIYRSLAAFPGLSWDFRLVLERLARDEEDHAQKLRLAQRLQREEILSGVKLPESRVEELLREVEELLAGVRSRQLAEAEAVALAVRLEQEFCLVHVEAVAEFADPQMKKMFQALARDDQAHMETLQSHLATR